MKLWSDFRNKIRNKIRDKYSLDDKHSLDLWSVLRNKIRDKFFNPRINVTDYLLKKTTCLDKLPEYTPNWKHYSMFNTGGVEVEVGEFLYAFVKMTKPVRILETGTHHGISSLYMAQALKENKKGHLTTLEIFEENIQLSRRLWKEAGVSDTVTCFQQDSLKFESAEQWDILFLDSEPHLRFDELVKYYPYLSSGGFIFIHDLHPHLGLSGLVINGVENWPYGDFRPKFGDLVKDYSLQTFSFRTPRGFTIFQKTDQDFAHTRYLRDSVSKQDLRP